MSIECVKEQLGAREFVLGAKVKSVEIAGADLRENVARAKAALEEAGSVAVEVSETEGGFSVATQKMRAYVKAAWGGAPRHAAVLLRPAARGSGL